MVDGHYGTVVDGVFTSRNGPASIAASSPVPIASLLRGTVVVITLRGKSSRFAVAITSTNVLDFDVHHYNNSHLATFHYSSRWGRVNGDWDGGTFARHYVPYGGPFTAVLTLRGSDRTVSFSVNGVPQNGAWPLPTTDVFYLILATNGGGTIAVTDVMVTMITADLA